MPGWHEPERLGVELQCVPGEESSRGLENLTLKIHIYDEVNFIGLRCHLGSGTRAQLLTRDDPPKVYELRAPETDLILSTWPRVFESPTQTVCIWTIRVLSGNNIWFDVDAWQWDKRIYSSDLPRPPRPPEVAKIHEDFSDLLKLETRARKIAERSTDFSAWTDERFEQYLKSYHPLPDRTPEEIRALLESAPIIRQKMQALKTRAGRRSLGLEQ